LIAKFDSAGVFQFSWSIPDISGFLATAPVPVPEPASGLMAITAITGLAALRFLGRQRRVTSPRR
jgi:hypothetical protein